MERSQQKGTLIFMNDSKLGNFEAIALIFTITANLTIITLTKHLINSSGPATLLNTIYIGILAILLTLLISKLFNRFPGLDILDVSQYLGGKILQTIVGLMFIIYAILALCISIKIFSNYLQTLYFPETDIFFITSLFIITVGFICGLNYNAIPKANIILAPIVIISMLFLFISDSKYFHFENIFPIMGNGFSTTFLSGTSNMFALSGISCLYLLPSTLKNSNQFKKIALSSTLLSLFYLLISISTILFMFNTYTLSNELLPLFSAVRYIEFGTFFQRLDSIFILIWTLSLTCSTGVVAKLALMSFKKVTNVKDTKPVIYPFALIVLGACLLQTTEHISDFLASSILKYVFWILSIFICLSILILANIKKRKSRLLKFFIYIKSSRRFQMKSIIRKFFIFTIIIIFLYGFSDSYSSHNIDSLAFVIALGIDSTESNELKVTFQFTNNSSFSENGTSSSDNEIINDTVEASSIDTAINLMNTYIGKKISMAHCKAVVFSESIAKRGISKEIYSLINNYEVRPTTNIIVSKIDAKTYIQNSTSNFETLITKYYEVFPSSAKYTGYTSNVIIGQFSNSINNSNYNATAILGGTIDASLDNISSAQNTSNITSNNSPINGKRKTENIGLAVFKGDTLVGELTALETLCHSIITNEVSTFTISITDPEKNNEKIDLSCTTTKKPKVNVNVSGTSPYINIDIFIDGNVLSVKKDKNYFDKNYIQKLNTSTNIFLKKSITEYLYKTSVELHSDIDYFSKSAVINFLTLNDWNSYNWNDNYKNAFFNVNVKTNIKSSILLTQS